MSNPSYGPAGQPGAVPTNGTSYPGAAAPQGYGAPAPVVMPKLPGRGGAITTLVLGVVLMVIIAPIVFFATMVAGVAGTEGNSVKGGTTANGANIIAFNASPEVVTKVFAMPFVWGTVVGVAGLIVLIVGIVLLVNANGKRRRITQEAMLGAVR